MIQAIESMVGSMKNNYYDSTILYYNRNAAEFCDNTVNANITQIQDLFLSKLEKNSYILDFGCGSGRDTKYFLELGFHVDAVDGSEELCRLAEKYTGIEVKQMYFKNYPKSINTMAFGRVHQFYICRTMTELTC